jgi:HK97 family phage major capsid protein
MKVDHLQRGTEPITCNLSETIGARQLQYSAGLNQLEAAIATGKSGAEIDQQLDQLAGLNEEISRLGRAEQTLSGQLIDVSRSGRGLISRSKNKGLPFGTHHVRLALARYLSNSESLPIDEAVERLFPGEQATLAVAKSATSPATTTQAGWAQELVRSEVRGMLQTDLAPISIAAALAVRGVALPFNGAKEVTIPSVSARGVALAGAWVGENGVIPVVRGQVNAIKAARYKLGAITVLTNELRRVSDPDAVELLRQMLLQDAANLLDTNLLDASPSVIGIRPAGLLSPRRPGCRGG